MASPSRRSSDVDIPGLGFDDPVPRVGRRDAHGRSEDAADEVDDAPTPPLGIPVTPPEPDDSAPEEDVDRA